MITICNFDSSKPFKELFSKICERGEDAWKEVTQNGEKFQPDVKTLRNMYETGRLKMLVIYKEDQLCGHILLTMHHNVFNVERKALQVLSIYIYPEFRNLRIFPKIFLFLRHYAKENKCKEITLAMPALDRRSNRLLRYFGYPQDYLYKLEVK